MFCKVIGSVGWPWTPVDLELFLGYTILDPIELHVQQFEPLLFDLFVDKFVGGGVVNLLDWDGWFGMPHFFEGDTKRDCIGGILK